MSSECQRLKPLSTLESFLSWKPWTRAIDEAGRGARKLQQNGPSVLPKLLVCHDLQGNYGDDSIIGGAKDPTQFALYDWHLIDVFVYFSHHLVTIPTRGWIDAAHQHQVPVLGTFITEWGPGEKLCEELFSTEEIAEEAARQLASIAEYFNFEGWLVNIENGLSVQAVPNVIHFLRSLRRHMRKATSHAQVIWYDAVTVEGKLQWQDTLNDLNKPFFDACDGLFVNYTWKATTPRLAAAAAGDRVAQIYMGIDVFGRGTYGGAKFNCAAALRASYAQGLSCALFAPGWVWEEADPRTEWIGRNAKFWNLIEAAIRDYRACRPTVVSLPFKSSFDQGAGAAKYDQGSRVSAELWWDLHCQDVQPLFQEKTQVWVGMQPVNGADKLTGVSVDIQWLQARILRGSAFNGGSFLRIEGVLGCSQEVELPLFCTAISVPETISARLVARFHLDGCMLSLAVGRTLSEGTRQAGERALGDFGEPQQSTCFITASLQASGLSEELTDGDILTTAKRETERSIGQSRKIQHAANRKEIAEDVESRQKMTGWPGGWWDAQQTVDTSPLKGEDLGSIVLRCSTRRSDCKFSVDIGEVSLQASVVDD